MARKTNFLFYSLMLGLSTIAVSAAQAQDAQQLDQITVTAQPPAAAAVDSQADVGEADIAEPGDAAADLRDSTTGTSTLGEEDLARSNEGTVYEAITSLPNVTPTPPGPLLPAIRGEAATPNSFLSGSFLFGSTPRSALVVDGITRSSSFANSLFQSLYDVKQVQVLRGPQHTVPGSSPIAGVFLIETNDPEFRDSAGTFTEVTFNEYNDPTYRVAGYANAAISREAAIRLVAEYTRGDDNVEYIEPPAVARDLDDLDDFNSLNLRGKFLVKPDSVPGLSLLLSGEYSNGLDRAFNGYSDQQPLSDRRRTAGDARLVDTEGWATGLKARYKLNSQEELASNTSFTHDEFSRAPRSNAPLFQYNYVEEERFAQDFTYSFQNVNRFSGVIGAGLTDSDKFYDVTIDFAGGLGGITDADIATQSIYADIAWNFASQFDLLFGGRIERLDDERDLAIGTLAGVQNFDYDVDDVYVLPKIGLRYRMTPEDTVSVSARKGYNAGGAYIFVSNGTVVTYDDEEVWTYEAAYRMSRMNNRLQLGVTAFYNDFTDKQLVFAVNGFDSRITNEPDAISYGLEFEGKYAVTDNLDLMGGFGLLQTEINKVSNNSPASVRGNEFGQDPSYTFNIGAAWRPIKDLELTGKVTYVDEYYSNFNNLQAGLVGDYTLVDIGASYKFNENTTFRAFINNVTDETAVYYLQPGALRDFTLLQGPRTYGLSLDMKF